MFRDLEADIERADQLLEPMLYLIPPHPRALNTNPA